MTYCDNQALREEMYRAYSTRASDQGPNAGKWDNSPVMAEILALRHELAQLLGFDSYADKSLATKMAENPQQVLDFLTDLAKRARPQGEKELAQLRAFAKAEFGVDELQPWDIAYYSEKQKQHLYSISDEQLRPYFPENKAVNGLFEVVKRIYGITAKERTDVDVWHPDVRFFELYDEKNELRGSFYLDLYARENKRGGAWMDDCVGQMRKADGSLQKPVAYLTCNFNRPVNGKPALFTHDEVITLFHEFGHGLHHMLTRIETAGVAGISGVPWDAVELPSQFMENWCWEPDALAFISGHYETGEPLPQELLDKMLAAKNYQAAMFILRQLEFGLFDFRLHAEFSPEQGRKSSKRWPRLKAGRRDSRANLGPLPARVQPYLRRRLCGRLLQLPVGRRAGGGCLLALRRRGDFQPRNRPVVPRQHPDPRRFRRANGAVQTLPRPRAAAGRDAGALRDQRLIVT
jgi:oligopeptidase A